MLAKNICMQLAVLILTCCCAWGQTAVPRAAGVFKLVKPPVIDGKLAENEWPATGWESDFTTLGKPDPAVKQTSFILGSTEDALYLAVKCLEPDLANRSLFQKDEVEIWKHDGLEFFLTQPGAENYFQFLISAAGNRFLLKFRPKQEAGGEGWESAASDFEGGYIVEIKIPFALIGAQPKAGDMWRFNLARNCLTPNADRHSSWAQTGSSFHDQEKFGTMLFLEKNSAAEIKQLLFRQRFSVISAMVDSYISFTRSFYPDFGRQAESELAQAGWEELEKAGAGKGDYEEEKLDTFLRRIEDIMLVLKKLDHRHKELLKEKLFR
jgi:hypothetical protein